MGAVTALLYSSTDQQFAGLVLDSPFCSLSKLALELANFKFSLPSFILRGFLGLINKSISSRAGFTLESIDLSNVICNINIPAVFVASNEDKMVNIEHSKMLQSLYKGNCIEKIITGDHNGPRYPPYKKFVGEYFLKKFEEFNFLQKEK